MQTEATRLVIRRATPIDATALSEFARRAFSEAFAADNTPEDMQSFLAATYSPALQRAEIERPALVSLLLERAGTLVGYAQVLLRATSPHVSAAEAAEIKRFYIDSAAHGTGAAHTLMERCLATAAGSGATCIFLGVFERNLRAIRFYGKHGFTRVGQQTFTVGSDVQRDAVLARSLP